VVMEKLKGFELRANSNSRGQSRAKRAFFERAAMTAGENIAKILDHPWHQCHIKIETGGNDHG